MNEFDPDAFLDETGIETRLGGAPSVEPPLSSAGAQAQTEMLRCLASVQASIAMLEVAVRDRPNDDATFDALNANFGQSLEEARAAFQRFRERRDCKGQS